MSIHGRKAEGLKWSDSLADEEPKLKVGEVNSTLYARARPGSKRKIAMYGYNTHKATERAMLALRNAEAKYPINCGSATDTCFRVHSCLAVRKLQGSSPALGGPA